MLFLHLDGRNEVTNGSENHEDSHDQVDYATVQLSVSDLEVVAA